MSHDFFKKHSDVCGVINFAAFKAVGESVQKPLVYYRNSLSILINVLECVQEWFGKPRPFGPYVLGNDGPQHWAETSWRSNVLEAPQRCEH